MRRGALAGIKVLELATMVAGPYCGKLLADLGADVVKVEPPEGDPARTSGPFPEGGPHSERSALFLYNNTSKRGVTLDLDVAEAREPLERLIRWADLLIDALPGRRLERLGLPPEAVSRLNPSLVYTSIGPYGRRGPRADARGDELPLMHAGGRANLLPPRAEPSTSRSRRRSWPWCGRTCRAAATTTRPGAACPTVLRSWEGCVRATATSSSALPRTTTFGRFAS